MFPFARSVLLWLAAAAVKAQDELAPLGLDRHRRLASESMIRRSRISDAACVNKIFSRAKTVGITRQVC